MMTELAALTLIALGNLNLMLAMDRHHRAYNERLGHRSDKRTKRLIGTGMLLLALALMIYAAGLGIGITEWALLTGTTAMLQSFLMPIVFKGNHVRHPTLDHTPTKQGPIQYATFGSDSRLGRLLRNLNKRRL